MDETRLSSCTAAKNIQRSFWHDVRRIGAGVTADTAKQALPDSELRIIPMARLGAAALGVPMNSWRPCAINYDSSKGATAGLP